MSDTLTVAPETAQPAPPASDTVAVAPPPEPAPPQTPQQTSRADLYRRYYDTPSAPAGDPPAPESAPEPTAQVAPPEPVAPTPAAPDFASLQAEIVALRAQLTPPTPPPTAPAQPEVWLNDWLALAREGKMKEAQDLLIAKTKETILPDTIAPAVARSREIARAEADVERFVNDLRVANPDLVPLEEYITFQAERRLADLRAAGKISTTAEFVTHYKLAVNEAAQDARKLALTLRGQGKQEAQTRTREVMQSSTLPPTGATEAGLRPSQVAPQAPPVETTEDYFAKRRALESKGRGLG